MIDDKIPLILVVEDVEETRDGIEKLLKADGYRVDPARDEADAVVRARRARPDLILVSLAGPATEVIATSSRIRAHAGLGDSVPAVIFCIDNDRRRRRGGSRRENLSHTPGQFRPAETVLAKASRTARCYDLRSGFFAWSEQPIIFGFHDAVALAGIRFQSLAVEDPDMAPRIMDQAEILKVASSHCDTLAASP